MKIDKIKPIPKYILEKIEKLDQSLNIKPCGLVRYYAYLTKNDGELCKVTCAVKIYKDKWYCKQVAVHGLHSEKCFCRDIAFTYMGGYSVGWHAEGITLNPRWFEDGKWYDTCGDKYFNPYARLINPEYALKMPEFKYSACDLYKGEDIIEYLRTYEKYPQVEMLVKLGLSTYALSKQILTKIEKDKSFRKWLFRNRAELNSPKIFYVSAILSAYKQGKPVEAVQAFEARRKDLMAKPLAPIRAMFKDEYEKYFAYVKKQGIGDYTYLDYLNACDYLGIDMTENKNRYPHDFRHWHDVRIDQRATAKAKQDEQDRKQLYEKFTKIALKYMPLQETNNGAYVVYIAKSPADLIREGDALHHCVGKFNYDQKVCREQSLIFFVRSATDTETPLTTIEYDIKGKYIKQCYAKGNTTPDKAITDYVNNVWLPHANKQLKKIAA